MLLVMTRTRGNTFQVNEVTFGATLSREEHM